MQFIGKSVPKKDGITKVTGEIKYVDDIKMPNMLYGAVKRSPYAHANILMIDISKALALKGVKAIITGQDVTEKVGFHLADKTFLAVDKVRYVGEGVAAVAATSKIIAKEALKLIEVKYEELEPVTNAKDAMKQEGPLVHPELRQYKKAPIVHATNESNICDHFKVRKGNMQEIFETAEYVFENEFYVPHIQHATLENHCAIAKVDRDKGLSVWSATQSPFVVRKILSDVYKIPLNKLRVIAPTVGGGFGAKTGNTIEGIVTALALKTKGKPVKLSYGRKENFCNSFVRPALFSKFKTAVNKHGKILGMAVEFIWDGGANAEFVTKIAKSAGYSCVGPYDIENINCDSYTVYTNNLVGGPYRSFGMSEIHFGIEQNIDAIADALGIDPLQMRMLNAHKEGRNTATNAKVQPSCGYIECLQKVADKINFNKGKEQGDKPWKIRAKGIAGGSKAPAMPPNVASSAIIRLNEDGSLYLSISSQDLGQGSNTVMAQIVAEILSVPIDKISVNTGDTANTPYEWQTVASRTTYCTGNAVIKACEDVKNQLFTLAGLKSGETTDNFILKNEQVVCQTDNSKRIEIADLALGLTISGGSGIHGPIIGRGVFIPEGVKGLDYETGQGDKPVAFWTYGANAVEIEIDIETGRIEILNMVSCWDVGKVMNPMLIETQCQGAMLQGLGACILEEIKFNRGRFSNASFSNYKIPTVFEAPRMDINFIENEQEDGPFGARAIGEPAMVAVAPAIANAVYNAIGIRIFELPLSSQNIYKQLKSECKSC